MAQASAELEDCTATVGELQSCLDASVAAFHQAIGSRSCDDVKIDGTTTARPATQNPPAYQALQMKCPNIRFNRDSSSTGGSQPPPSPTGCDDTCTEAKDGFCDDGGSGSSGFNTCGLGTDCTHCGQR